MRTLACIKDFRKLLVEHLQNANISGIGDNVFESRKENAWPEEEGFIVVYTPSTQFDDQRTSPRYYTARGEVYIDLYSSADEITDVNEFLDDVSNDVINALQKVERMEAPFKGLVKRFVLKSFTNNLSEGGESSRGSQRIVYSVEYAICFNNSAPKDEFLKAKNELNMGEGVANSQVFETNLRNN